MSKTFTDRLLVLPQYLIPQHFLSSLMYKLTRCTQPLIKDTFIRRFIDLYKVDMSLAEQPDPAEYDCFNAFFTRSLKPEARPFADDENSLLCPVDGAVSQVGPITNGRLIQAKGMDYSLLELLAADTDMAAEFSAGEFSTLYLSPRDYHRIHMPVDATLRKMIYVPGKLFGVNQLTARVVDGLFARNERVIALFDTELGPMAMILVGAIFVGSMETVWEGMITPCKQSQIRVWDYADKDIRLKRGEEMGRFNMGSTVIMLFPEDSMRWDESIQAEADIRMGQVMAVKTIN